MRGFQATKKKKKVKCKLQQKTHLFKSLTLVKCGTPCWSKLLATALLQDPPLSQSKALH